MKRVCAKYSKLLAVVVLISTLLTGCSLLPANMLDMTRGSKSDPVAIDDNTPGGDTVTISRAEYERLQRYSEMDELMQLVEIYYYQEPDTDAMLENAERGLLYGLEDPYTYYYNPEQYAAMWEDDEGEYAGIGIQLMGSYETYLCTITRVFANSPAQEAGLRKGDILTRVEDLEVTAYTMQDAVDIMRGEVGKTVSITVDRDGQSIDFNVPRAVVHVNWVSSCMLEGNVGYIVLYEFSGDCATTFATQLDALVKQGATSLIIDLRDNPGGWVDAAIKIADLFLPKSTIAYTEMRDGTREYYSATDGASDLPLVVLQNENSASASEIMAGAFQDHKRATIVGTTSFGKGVVQYVLPVGTQGAGMQLTIAQYFTPNGNVVQKTGITPDVEVTLPEGDTNPYQLGDLSDVQLKKAHEVALGLIK